ncbi:hypothetical protein [Roseomonas sp. 18066]|uniref:hypothetical protein n=1 Tax=Roseomonas sp. 18066 TaxID=2681412 RepID=UPI00135AD964|nr:hypothetical protein [Roseomonas sp. 18066]
MKRLALSLLLLTGACAVAPRSAEEQQSDAARAACRVDAERQMRYRERGQTMRVDEAESRMGSGAYIGNPLERSQMGARFEMEQMIQECLRGANAQPAATPAPAAATPAAPAPTPAATPPVRSRRGS